MAYPAAEIDHGQAVAQIAAVAAEPHQPGGLQLVGYVQLGKPAAVARDVQAPGGSGQRQAFASAKAGSDDLDFPLKALLQVAISVDRFLPGRGSDGGIGLEDGLVFEQRILVAFDRRNGASAGVNRPIYGGGWQACTLFKA